MVKRLIWLRVLLVAALVMLIAGAAAWVVLVVLDPPAYHGPRTFWAYQCIDTAKSSRDQARNWAKRADLPKLIDRQMSLIAATGANCVAIDTPYDPEFNPVLAAWVAGARAHHLRVWFRGGFSSWEGWFDYPKGMSTDELMAKTKAFITGDAGLFADGDVFTAAPEAENGGPFDGGLGPDSVASYRSLLVTETAQAGEGFAAIGKHVVTSWDAMNGGLARDELDRATVAKLGGVVTIDHFVADPAGMGGVIDLLERKLGARVMVGAWGAPVPGINGAMSAQQQATFARQVLGQAAHQGVAGINYWTLSDDTTAIVDGNLQPLPAYDVLRSFFRPAVLVGTVGDGNKPVADALLTVGGMFSVRTDKQGHFALLVPSGEDTVRVAAQGHVRYQGRVQLAPDSQQTFSVSLLRE